MALTSLEDLSHVPGPCAWIAAALREQLPTIRTLCFMDNEYGEKAQVAEVFKRRVEVPVIRRLRRMKPSLRITTIRIDPRQLHTVEVTFSDISDAVQKVIRIAIYQPSERARARERNFELAGEEYSTGAPRRGKRASGESHAVHERVREATKARKQAALTTKENAG